VAVEAEPTDLGDRERRASPALSLSPRAKAVGKRRTSKRTWTEDEKRQQRAAEEHFGREAARLKEAAEARKASAGEKKETGFAAAARRIRERHQKRREQANPGEAEAAAASAPAAGQPRGGL